MTEKQGELLRIEQMKLATEIMKNVPVASRDNWTEKYLDAWSRVFQRIKKETDL